MYKHTIETLADPQLTTVILFCRPDTANLEEAARTSTEFYGLGIDNQQLVINGMFDCSLEDEVARAWKYHSRAALTIS